MRASLRLMLRSSRPAALLAVSVILVAACSSTAATPPAVSIPTASLASTPGASTAVSTPAASGSPTATATPGASAPAVFQLAVTGDANVTGTWSKSYGVNCNNPTYDGLDILFFAQSPDTQAVVLITLTQGSIGVSERHGAGAAYTDREFQGTGVTVFDPAKGATFDSELTTVPGSGQKPGALGAITHITGSVDCGSQVPGTSTVALSGSTAEGAVSGPFQRFRIGCNTNAQYGSSVTAIAIVSAGATPSLLIINLPASGKATIFSATQSPPVNHSYAIAPTGTLTTTAGGAHVEADFLEVLPAGATGPAHTIHLAGDMTCGVWTTS